MASNPYQHDGPTQQPAIPQADRLPQATPLGPKQTPPQAERVLPQAQPVVPQGQPVLPQARPVPDSHPVPQAQPLPQAQRAPQDPGATPQARPLAKGQPGAAAGRPIAARPVAVQAASATAIRRRDPETEPEEELSSIALKSSPPWLVSAVFHMLVLIILGLSWMALKPRTQVHLEVVADDIYAEKLGDQLEFDSPLGKDRIDAAEEPVWTPDNLPEVDDPFAAPSMLEIQPDGSTATSDIESTVIGLALNGREEGMKRSLLGRYGGTKLTEEAVQRGLQWLAKNQASNGSWSLAGPYDGGVPRDLDNRAAATAMALLAFQGAGNTHQKGRFRKNVVQGWKWLLKEQDEDGNFFHFGPHNHPFYTQGQCTIAICELYGMTKDAKYKGPAERAVQYCLNAQSPQGGWRYDFKSESDVSVTGWIVMALESARMADLEVPDDHFRRVERYLDVVAQGEGSRYPYRRGGDVKLSMTAEALLCRQYLGWPRDDERLVRGVEWITSPENLVNFDRGRDVYYWYYATQVAHHMEGEYWKRWNAVMRQVLPEQQLKRGREGGSWDPEKPTMDQWAPHGGRLYVTCLSIYMLEVYYRHLPIYAKVYTNLLKSGRTKRY